MTADWEPKVEVLLGSEGWQEVVKPAMEASIEHVRLQLELPATQRQNDFKEVSDDFMRGQLQALRWMVNKWQQELETARANRARFEAQQQDIPPTGSPYAEGADYNPDSQPVG